MRTVDSDVSGVLVDFAAVRANRLSTTAVPGHATAYDGRRDSDPSVMLGFVVLVVASTMLAALVAAALLLVA
jgi:hypothetical protein